MITGTIPITTDADVYSFTAAPGDRLVIQVDGNPERDATKFNPNFDVLDASGTVLLAVDSDSTLGDRQSEAAVYTATVASTYYVRVKSDATGPTTGTYNLHAWLVPSGCPPVATATVTATAPAATVTPTAPATATVTATANATVTCVPQAGGWAAGAPLSAGPVVRGNGTYFPGNNRFYVLGGRSSDTAGSDYLNPHEYNPATNTWITKTATFTSSLVNNMVSGVLTVGGNSVIVAVGGSAAGGTVATGDVRLYNPVADTMTTLTTDPWPEGAISNTLPGGSAVVSNKLYVLGGFNLTGARNVVDTIWEMDPARPAGSRWLQKSAHLPTAMGYIPAGAIGGLIYIGGGATWDGTNLIDTTNAYKYDPAADTISAITALPTATSNTRAAVFNGKLWVIGGVFLAPAPDVQIYDPVANSWTAGPPLTTGRRNLSMDTDGTHIFVVGGYTGAAPGTPLDTLEIYTAPVVCGTVTATSTPATPTQTRTNTPTNTPPPVITASATRTNTPPATSTVTPPPTVTPCPIQFNDVPVGSTSTTTSAAWPAGASSAATPAAGPANRAPASTTAPATTSRAARSARSSPSRRASPTRCRAPSRPSRMCRPAAPSGCGSSGWRAAASSAATPAAGRSSRASPRPTAPTSAPATT